MSDQESFAIKDLSERQEKCYISNSYDYSVHRIISTFTSYRGEISRLINIIQNAFGLSSFPSKIEMLIRIDDDQLDLYNNLISHEIINRYNVKIYSGRRYSYVNLHVYIDEMIHMASGDIFVGLADGGGFADPGWDEELYSHVNSVAVINFSGCKKFGDILDPFPFFNFNQVITRKLYDIIGHFYPTLFGDYYIDRLGSYSGIRVQLNSRFFEEDNPICYDLEKKKADLLDAHNHKMSEKIQNQLKLDIQKVIDYKKCHNIPIQEHPYVIYGFLNGYPTISLAGGIDNRHYQVEFISKNSDVTVLNILIKTYNYIQCLVDSSFYPLHMKVSSEEDGVFFEKEMEIKG